MLVDVHPENPQKRLIIRIAEILKSGGVIAYPTDTTYGFGCSLFHKKAIETIYKIKNIPPHKPLSFICKDISQASHYANIPDYAYRIMKKTMPGPYTFIFPATAEIPKIMLRKRKHVGIRIPSNPISESLLEEMDEPIINSTVVDGGCPLCDPELIYDKFYNQTDAIVSGGILNGDTSTVIDFTGDEPVVVREGCGSVEGLF
ncbi:MAG: L-threonylcarbamoyladenylate synthase [Pseudomonadota bacterium]